MLLGHRGGLLLMAEGFTYSDISRTFVIEI